MSEAVNEEAVTGEDQVLEGVVDAEIEFEREFAEAVKKFELGEVSAVVVRELMQLSADDLRAFYGKHFLAVAILFDTQESITREEFLKVIGLG